jgi:hypothetical protein
MGIGVGIFLIAVGAILTFALETEVEGIDLNAVGVILMIVGGFGVLLSLAFWSSWGGSGVRRTTVRRSGPGGAVIEERHDEPI